MYSVPHASADDRGNSRAFTVASAPSEPLVRLTTRLADQPSSFKRALLDLAPGATVEVSGPHGNFVYDETAPASVFIAGGIGITPFRSILADLAGARTPPKITLLYSNSTPAISFRTFLDGLTDTWQQLRVVYTVTRPSPAWHGPTQRIGASFIQQHAPRAEQAVYYVCGPTAFVMSVRAALLEIGVESRHIHDEGFPGYEPATTQLSASQ